MTTAGIVHIVCTARSLDAGTELLRRLRVHGISLLVVERGMDGFSRGRKLDKIGMQAQDTAAACSCFGGWTPASPGRSAGSGPAARSIRHPGGR